jgi:hypothetical protein
MPKPSVLFFFVGLLSGLLVAGMRPTADRSSCDSVGCKTEVANLLEISETLASDRCSESAAWEDFWVEAAPAHWENRWRGVSRVNLKSSWDAMGAELRAGWDAALAQDRQHAEYLWSGYINR